MIADQDGLSKAREIALPNPTFYFRPDWSPDGEHLVEGKVDLVFEEEGQLVVVDYKSDAITEDRLHVPNLLRRYQRYFQANRERLLKAAPRRADGSVIADLIRNRHKR